jgi:hypothetical protein
MDFTEALNELIWGDEEAVFLKPLINEVINSVRAISGISRVQKKHRI